jgi:hypothetical protein
MSESALPTAETPATPLEVVPPEPQPVNPMVAHKPWKDKGKGGISNLVGHIVSIEDIESALTRFEGDRGKASSALNMTRKRLNMAINQHRGLKAKWRKYTLTGPATNSTMKRLPDEVSTISREPLVPLNETGVLQSEAELAAQIEREDRKIQQGIIKFGGTEEDAELAVSLRSFHGRQIQSTLALTATGVSLNFVRMQKVLRKLEKRIEEGNFKENAKGEPAEEAMVYESYRALTEECRHTAELAQKASWLAAKIENLKQSNKGSGSVRGKPGFAAKGDTKIIAHNVILKP